MEKGERNAYTNNVAMGVRFAQSLTDNIELLLPLIQCCTIQPTTVASLMRFYNGPETLSAAMRRWVNWCALGSRRHRLQVNA
jgi:hypothetical protein